MRIKTKQQGFTLLEIMLVVSIIVIILGVAISKLGNTTAIAKTMRVQADVQAIKTQLQLYESMSGFFSTTEQGLQALVTQPQNDPRPTRWYQFFKELPKDPWGSDYHLPQPGPEKSRRVRSVFRREPTVRLILHTTIGVAASICRTLFDLVWKRQPAGPWLQATVSQIHQYRPRLPSLFLGCAESCHAYAAASSPAKESTVVIPPVARSGAILVRMYSAFRRDLE